MKVEETKEGEGGTALATNLTTEEDEVQKEANITLAPCHKRRMLPATTFMVDKHKIAFTQLIPKKKCLIKQVDLLVRQVASSMGSAPSQVV